MFYSDKKEWYTWTGWNDDAESWGGEWEWRLAAFKMMNETQGLHIDVLVWAETLHQFLDIVLAAFSQTGENMKGEAERIMETVEGMELGGAEFTTTEEEAERFQWERKHPAGPPKGGGAITFILVAVLAVLAFLLMSR